MPTVYDASHAAALDLCQDALIACEACLSAMLSRPSHNDCPAACRESVDVLGLCVRAMIRDSRFAPTYAGVAAEVLEWCAGECDAYELAACQACGTTCRDCVQELRQLAE